MSILMIPRAYTSIRWQDLPSEMTGCVGAGLIYFFIALGFFHLFRIGKKRQEQSLKSWPTFLLGLATLLYSIYYFARAVFINVAADSQDPQPFYAADHPSYLILYSLALVFERGVVSFFVIRYMQFVSRTSTPTLAIPIAPLLIYFATFNVGNFLPRDIVGLDIVAQVFPLLSAVISLIMLLFGYKWRALNNQLQFRIFAFSLVCFAFVSSCAIANATQGPTWLYPYSYDYYHNSQDFDYAYENQNQNYDPDDIYLPWYRTRLGTYLYTLLPDFLLLLALLFVNIPSRFADLHERHAGSLERDDVIEAVDVLPQQVKNKREDFLPKEASV